MVLAVVGSRNFDNFELLSQEVDHIEGVSVILSGGAEGADTLANQYAKQNQIEIQEFLPDWKRHGRFAGAIRNKEMVKAADQVIAFWDGKSKGTKITIDYAEKQHKLLKVVRF